MTKISRLQYDILNALYFVEPLEHILEEVEGSRPAIIDTLRQLIDGGYVVPYAFSEEKNDFIRSFMYDSDNMDQFRYLATKEGLLLHTNSEIKEDD